MHCLQTEHRPRSQSETLVERTNQAEERIMSHLLADSRNEPPADHTAHLAWSMPGGGGEDELME